jgi:hypothetical protein
MIETNFDNCVGPLHCVSLLKDVTRELKVHRGTTQLEQFIIIFRGPFYRECVLNDYIIYLRTYEQQYCVITIYCDNCQNRV